MIRLQSFVKWPLIFAALIWIIPIGSAQECSADTEIDAQTSSAITSAAGQYLRMASSGDYASLRQSSMPAVANAFGPVEEMVAQNKDSLSGRAFVEHLFVLDAASVKGDRAEFFCGVFGANGHTSTSTSFAIPNLPPARYALVVQQISGANPVMFSVMLQQTGAQWKIAGLYLRPATINGHNSDWFANQAAQYQTQGKGMLAWLYYYVAWDLQAPVSFMSTLKLDRISGAMQQIQAPELPQQGAATLTAPNKTYRITQMFPLIDHGKLDLIVKYETPDVSNTTQMFQDNTGLMKALVTQHPELKTAFDQMVARAVAPSGQDYGTVLAVKDIK